MARALIDANVVFGFRMVGDQWHDRASRIVEAMDEGELPCGLVTDVTLAQILDPIQKHGGNRRALATLKFLEQSTGFRVRHLARNDIARGRELFRKSEGVEFSDTTIVAHMRRTGVEYVYSFDDDFDRFDDVTRLTTAANPFRPS